MIESMLTPALALTVQEAAAATGGDSLGGAFVGLVLGLLQLVVSLAIFTFSINQGLSVVSKMIDGIDIWGEIKRKNMAVALLAAGAVVAIGGIANLVVAIAVAGLAISWTFKAMDKFTKDIDEKQEFRGGNVAIGIVYAGILVGASELIASGVSGVSSGITALINALI